MVLLAAALIILIMEVLDRRLVGVEEDVSTKGERYPSNSRCNVLFVQVLKGNVIDFVTVGSRQKVGKVRRTEDSMANRAHP